MTAAGSYSTTGNSYSFLDTESSNDVFSLTDNVYGQWNGSFHAGSNETQSMGGKTSPSSYSYTLSSDYLDTNSNSGETTAGTVTSPFSESGSSSGTYDYVITGPPAATVTLEATNTSTETTSGSEPSPPLQLAQAGWATTIGEGMADRVGSVRGQRGDARRHDPAAVGRVAGPDLGPGGQVLHPLEFEGAEITPTQSGSGIVLDEPNETNPSPG